jgi:hypothetical protein
MGTCGEAWIREPTTTGITPTPPPTPPPAGVPSITSALAAAGTLGAAFSYQIAASGAPTDFAAAGLPAGLVCADATGAITGTPQASGTFNVTLSAANKAGTGTANLVLTVTNPTPTPSNPTITISASLPAGTYEIVPAGSVVITKEMTIQQVMDAMMKAKSTPPPVDDAVWKKLGDLERGMRALVEKALQDAPK